MDCNINVVAYDSIDKIHKVYDQYAACTDGFIVSSSAAKAILEMVDHEIKRPIISFEIDSTGVYRSILNLLLRNRNLNMNRVILDFMIPLEIGVTANDYLNLMDSDYEQYPIDIWSKNLSKDSIKTLETQIVNEILRLWNMDAIDIVLCQYSNIVPILEKHNIPYEYAIETPVFLENVVKKFMYLISLDHMHENLPVMINVAASDNTLNTDKNIELITKHINDFLSSNMINSAMHKNNASACAVITVDNLHQITNNEQNCNLSVYLDKHLDFEVSIGYGIGLNLDMAIKNSHTARREALLSGKSFIFTEKGNLIGPLNSKACMVIENHAIYDIGKIAKNSSLSAVTIKRIISILKLTNSNMVTTQDLSSHLKSTVRNANRILKNLEKGGYAKITCTQTSNIKGRPTKVYELNFHI
ncbi:MAG: hypothetical protein ACLS50_02710 [Clostridium sp.]